MDTVSVPREVCGGSSGTGGNGGGGGSGFGGIGGGSGFGVGNAGSSSAGSYGGHRRLGDKQKALAYQEIENKLETDFGFELNDENIFSEDGQIEFSPSPFDVPFRGGKLGGNKNNSKYRQKDVLKDYLKTPIYRQKRKSSPLKEIKHTYQTSFT